CMRRRPSRSALFPYTTLFRSLGMRILFVCSQNRFRSPTAEAVFAGLEGLEVASAGLNSGAPTTVTGDLIEWADVIMVMEKTHLRSEEHTSELQSRENLVCRLL